MMNKILKSILISASLMTPAHGMMNQPEAAVVSDDNNQQSKKKNLEPNQWLLIQDIKSARDGKPGAIEKLKEYLNDKDLFKDFPDVRVWFVNNIFVEGLYFEGIGNIYGEEHVNMGKAFEFYSLLSPEDMKVVWVRREKEISEVTFKKAQEFEKKGPASLGNTTKKTGFDFARLFYSFLPENAEAHYRIGACYHEQNNMISAIPHYLTGAEMGYWKSPQRLKECYGSFLGLSDNAKRTNILCRKKTKDTGRYFSQADLDFVTQNQDRIKKALNL